MIEILNYLYPITVITLDRIAKYEYPGPERTTKIYKKIY